MNAFSPIVFGLFALLATPASAVDFTGPVVSILDGDTLEILHNNKAERIRLSGIDCPEKGQPYGHQAKQATAEMVFGKEALLKTHGRDRSGRILAGVRLPDGTHVNHTLVRDGWCWWYRKYAPGNRELELLEKNARAGRKGLWADSHPVPPWEWRLQPQLQLKTKWTSLYDSS